MKTKKKIIRTIFSIVGITAALCAAVVGFFAIKGAVMWNNAKAAHPITETVSQLQSENGFARIAELPEFYINAVISVEDRKFRTHNGINLKSIARAMLYDIKSLSFEQGGSTITQQLAKNLWFTQEKKIERKFAEVYAAFELENALSKDEIFELYVNTIYFGSGFYGITSAALGYFDKAPSELTEYECAMLAGLPNAPSAYSPDESPELARQRLGMVLDSMESNGVITAARAEEVMAAA
ncbi:MAG: transglycosylase domain-containing protein [Ruminococcaceae bacterium]|nr:transglycosylase domain-containing protein [Oscillospiraceae bacterium]